MRKFAAKSLMVLAVIFLTSIGTAYCIHEVDPLPGTLGAIWSRVNVGMPQSEAVALLLASGFNNIDSYYYSGVARDGRVFTGCRQFDELPREDETAHSYIEICDEQGRELVLTIGQGGFISNIWLRSPFLRESIDRNFSRLMGLR